MLRICCSTPANSPIRMHVAMIESSSDEQKALNTDFSLFHTLCILLHDIDNDKASSESTKQNRPLAQD